MTGKFIREWLPDPVDYFAAEGLTLKGQGQWRTTHCVFHDDKNPSMSINVNSGGFKCFACDARGGDVLTFHRERHGLSFVDAAKALGAWRSA